MRPAIRWRIRVHPLAGTPLGKPIWGIANAASRASSLDQNSHETRRIIAAAPFAIVGIEIPCWFFEILGYISADFAKPIGQT